MRNKKTTTTTTTTETETDAEAEAEADTIATIATIAMTITSALFMHDIVYLNKFILTPKTSGMCVKTTYRIHRKCSFMRQFRKI